jgi:hypothetical protein
MHTHTHTHNVKYSFYILERYLLFYTYCAYLQTKLYIYTWHLCTQYLNIQVNIYYLRTLHTFILTRSMYTQYMCCQYTCI